MGFVVPHLIRNPVEALSCASNWVHAALSDGRLLARDLGSRPSALLVASRRLGAGGSWQMVHAINSRAIYELCPAGSSPRFPVPLGCLSLWLLCQCGGRGPQGGPAPPT